ncbi:ThiF family adenylyltransferase [Cysteiniphilum litorale]|uniref:ThiF family adenylyltransferase n=1 Tax=Cysteiniphilum litorale TaxID=2056700 RepID=UPI003F88339B
MNLKEITFEKIIQKEINGDFLFLKLSSKKHLWSIKISVHGQPHHIPKAYLLNDDLIGSIPHVSEDGLICFEAADERILVDYHNPLSVLNKFIKDIYNLLERSMLKIYENDLFDEIEGFYSDIKLFVNSCYYANNLSEEIHVEVNDKKEPQLIYSSKYNNNIFKRQHDKLTIINGMHISINETMSPCRNRTALLEKILRYADSNGITEFDMSVAPQKPLFILASIPRSNVNEEKTQLFFNIKSNKKVNLKNIKNLQDLNIKIYKIIRLNKEYLLPRGGAKINISSYKVSIIGVGSIGSEILSMLSKTGISKFLIMDGDIFMPENIYRHRLGVDSTYLPNKVKYRNKVDALKDYIEKNVPYVKIESKNENLTKNNIELLKDSRVVIIAVGSISECLKFNSLIKNICDTIIYVFNEPNSYGGHVIAINMQSSCLECLFSFKGNIDDGFSFIDPSDSRVSHNITGCGDSYTSFSYIDTMQTASLAARAVVDILLGEYSESFLISWKNTFATGLKTNDRYRKNDLITTKVIHRSMECQNCNDR